MSGQTESQPSGWTPDLLFLHLQTQLDGFAKLTETQINSLTRMLDERFAAQTNDLTKASAANDKRFDSVNEFRAQLADMQSTLISRIEAGTQFNALDEKFNARFTGLDEHVKRIQSTIDRGFTAAETRTSTGKDNWGYLVGVVGIVSVAVTILLALTGR